MTDPISDFLIRIKNAYLAQKKSLVAPKSNQKMALSEILKKHKKIAKFSQSKEKKSIIKIKLKYIEGKPAFTDVKIFSLPGRRMYVSCKDAVKYRRTGGLVIISTSSGLKTVQEAIKEHLGGEVICEIN